VIFYHALGFFGIAFSVDCKNLMAVLIFPNLRIAAVASNDKSVGQAKTASCRH